MTPRMSEIDTFKSHVVQMPNGCQEWQLAPIEFGYGRFSFKRKTELAHRAAYRLLKGVAPGDLCVLHKCDNPRCVNPDHLFLGTRGDNARDMSAKGRQWVQKNPKAKQAVLVCPPERLARGERHGNAKLTDALVLTIRNRSKAGDKGNQIARDIGVSCSLVYMVIAGQIWSHVGGPIRSKT